MALKSEAQGNQLDDRSYPQVLIADTGMLVVFTASRTGTVLDVGRTKEGLYCVGYHSTTWEAGSFKPWRGTVTLTQD